MITIDHLYEKTLKALTSQGKIVQISQNLMQKDNNEERTSYVFDIVETLGLLPEKNNLNKSNEKSEKYKEQGNERFKSNSYFEAWQYYNLSLLYAPLGSDNIPLAYSNRSAVLCLLKYYAESLKDIETVFSLEYPEKLKDKLMKRKKLCLEALNKKKTIEDSSLKFHLMNMTSDKNPVYKAASSKLKVIHSEEMGRLVIANEDISVGEVIAFEYPYFKILIPHQILFNCTYCLSTKQHMMPCDNCCFALYCSENCKNKAYKEFHKIECPLMSTLIAMDYSKLELLALRTVIKARTDHTDWMSLIRTIKDAESNADNEFRGMVKIGDEWVYDSQFYTSIHMLENNVDKRSMTDIFRKSVTAATFLHLLKQSELFSDVPKESETEIIKLVGGLLLHHNMTTPTNMHTITCIVEGADGNFTEDHEIGCAPFAFHSLINHSCSPNVVRNNILNSGCMALTCLRPIKKGMQLFDNYGSHHALESRLERQKKLKFQYKFICSCEACANDWPLIFNMSPSNKLPKNIMRRFNTILDSITLEKLEKGDSAVAINKYKQLCELCADLEPYTPCWEVASCQESLKQCMMIINGTLPYGYTQIVKIDIDSE